MPIDALPLRTWLAARLDRGRRSLAVASRAASTLATLVALVLALLPVGVRAQDPSGQPPAAAESALPERGTLRDFAPDGVRSEPVSTGYLIYKGREIPAPFVVELRDEGIFVNDIPIQATYRSDGMRRRHFVYLAQQVADLENRLREGMMLIITDDANGAWVAPRTTLDVLEALTADLSTDERLNRLATLRVDGMGTWQWRDLLDRFQPGPNLAKRVKAAREAWEKARASRRGMSPALLQLITITGFLLSVLTLGFVLMMRPDPALPLRGLHDEPSAVRQVYYSVALFVVVNGYDLVTTLLTVRDGHMMELNPLTAGMMHDPAKVIAFKVGSTVLASIVLLSLRRHRTAQLGAWWVNVVYTVLLLRWAAATSLIV